MHRFDCPNCGAPLETDAKRMFCVCSYCGKRVALNEEDVTHQLAEQIKELIGPVEKYKALKLQLLAANNKEQNLVREFNKITSQKSELTVIGGSVLTFVLAFCIGEAGEANRFVSFLFAALVAVLAFYILRFIHRNKVVGIREDLRDSTRKCEDLEDYIENIESNYDFSFIPNGYRNREAMNFFYRVLITSRAKNLKQAIVYYDEYLERENDKKRQEDTIRMQQQQINELKKMKNSVRSDDDSKDIGAAMALGGALIFGAKILRDIRKYMK